MTENLRTIINPATNTGDLCRMYNNGSYFIKRNLEDYRLLGVSGRKAIETFRATFKRDSRILNYTPVYIILEVVLLGVPAVIYAY